MHILVLGATGRVGSQIVTLALQDGHQVRAMVRTLEKVDTQHDRLTVIQGNVLEPNDLVHAMHGVDAVISALNTDGTTTLSQSMPLLINAMGQEGIKRIITVGTAGILQSRTEPEKLRYQSSESRRKSTRAAEEHEQVYTLLRASTLEWTIVCPTYLPDGEIRGNYRVERDVLPEGGTEITVGDTAEFTYRQLSDRRFINTRVGICY
ncbi:MULTISPECIES: SDR family oxidoreductase [Paenibacillus]|uniref:SDR family oxidoreductase n=1 Tax=Paenibacillus cucumis (ex Kampfer et al. 2016) TaxID=1776858 RepID=A0ABS7KGF8_9BACL|nr:SDR family oxidoreductase [Paenibacillus cucumis (ex Kampfer et al. 2016)]MBY0203228.1 SDR family oxidoreductase [Paenibacillus cucumis (ex Kampfer et al. 2016)]MDP9697755.1 putative NADH-flavin reductase [Paenibacillus intestini]